jgi:hypothetical protein
MRLAHFRPNEAASAVAETSSIFFPAKIDQETVRTPSPFHISYSKKRSLLSQNVFLLF